MFTAAVLLSAGTGATYTPAYLEKILGQGIERDFKLNKKREARQFI